MAAPSPTRSPSDTALVGGSVDLGAGNDKLTLGNFANVATLANVESVVGGNAADTITLSAALVQKSNINLGAGDDKLTLGDFVNAGSVEGSKP